MMTKILTIVSVCAAIAFAAESFERPESAVPTPAEELRNSNNSRELAPRDKENWQKMREERKKAREQILSDLRHKPKDDKAPKRLNKEKNRDKKSRFEEDSPKKNIHEQRPAWEHPRFHDPNPPHEKPGLDRKGFPHK